MKWLSVIFSIIITPSFGQQYVPILGNTNEWRVVSCFNGCITDVYFTAEDTVVGGVQYRVLHGFHYINGNFLIRENVQDRKVYLKQTHGHSLLPEYVLYDFSIIDGDTVDVYNPLSPLPEYSGKFVLDSIVGRQLETQNHRHFYLHAVDPSVSLVTNTVWIEGVGSLSLINTPGAPPTEAEHVVCAIKDDELIYADLDSVFSCGPLSNRQPTEASGFRVYPNPATDELSFKVDKHRSPKLIQVFNSLGQMVLEANWGNSLNVSTLNNGIYLVTLIYAKGLPATQRVSIAR